MHVVAVEGAISMPVMGVTIMTDKPVQRAAIRIIERSMRDDVPTVPSRAHVVPLLQLVVDVPRRRINIDAYIGYPE